MKKTVNDLNILERMKAPTPKFFRILRNVGLTLTAAAGAVLAAPITIPAAVITVASYVAVAGTVLTSVSQATVDEVELEYQAKAYYES